MLETGPMLLGQRHGLWETFTPQGQLEMKGTYNDGKPTGKWDYYYPFGALMRTATYKDGKLQGKSVYYAKQGRIIEESGYKDGKKHGDSKRFDEKTGELTEHLVFDNGKMVKVVFRKN